MTWQAGREGEVKEEGRVYSFERMVLLFEGAWYSFVVLDNDSAGGVGMPKRAYRMAFLRSIQGAETM